MEGDSKTDTSITSRRPFVGGNWKSNGDPEKVTSWISILNSMDDFPSSVDVLVTPPALFLQHVVQEITPEVFVGAQNVSVHRGFGAFTGEISADMLRSINVNWTLVGHSERRSGFDMEGESSSLVATKTANAIASSMSTVVCVGETLEERQAERTMEVVQDQLQAVIQAIQGIVSMQEEGKDDVITTEQRWSQVVIAYEPVWAIGTGVTASAEQAQEVHAAIRAFLADQVSPSVASSLRIIYGGSVKPGNAQELISCEDIDGFLVGGASLTPGFAEIIQTVANALK